MPVALAALAAGLLPWTAFAFPATVKGRRVLVDGKTIHLKGVNWNPVTKGGVHPRDIDFAGNVKRDSVLMQEAGINVLRTYEAIVDTNVLDVLWAHGVQVINTVYNNAGEPLGAITRKVNAVKHHPAILMWAIGNEWNYNRCYSEMSFESCLTRVRDAARQVKLLDMTHPVASVYGELAPFDVIERMPEIDVWGTNYYGGATFSDLFDRWSARAFKPLFIGEFGADAFDTKAGMENEEAQAYATASLTYEINSRSVVWEDGVCLGGMIFELADEWWKDGGGSPMTQEKGGIAPGAGPYPDSVFNEEWWGLTRIDRSPRKAYKTYASIPIPSLNLTSVSGEVGALAAPGALAPQGTRLSCTSGGCTAVPSRQAAWPGLQEGQTSGPSVGPATGQPSVGAATAAGAKRRLRAAHAFHV